MTLYRVHNPSSSRQQESFAETVIESRLHNVNFHPRRSTFKPNLQGNSGREDRKEPPSARSEDGSIDVASDRLVFYVSPFDKAAKEKPVVGLGRRAL
mmetsp:Transcript_14122/g.16375  ORF Transcript_14122/g.16375 Transcript_14122/m.16375 type:complete len:97 (+) Transcript_14122:643-933(+)